MGTIVNVSVTENVAFAPHPSADVVLTREAVDFLVSLHHCFEFARRDLLSEREERQVRFDAGERLTARLRVDRLNRYRSIKELIHR